MLLLLHPVVSYLCPGVRTFLYVVIKGFGLRIASWAFFTNHSTNTLHY
uniref:Uncharacterized protein n=1 Tax=Anguilla anguilla TaxID=7936 RepID=A0A0E9Q9G3_ANGAN